MRLHAISSMISEKLHHRLQITYRSTMDPNQSSSSKADRKTIEKNRRTHMKGLYTELNSLVPRQNLREVKSLTDQLDEAEEYIKKLQLKLEKMKEKRESLMKDNPNARLHGEHLATQPQIEIHESAGNAVVLNLVTGLDCDFMFNETIRICHVEGLDIVNASFSVTENSVFHTIHSKVGEFAQEGAIARVTEKLNTFVAGSTSY